MFDAKKLVEKINSSNDILNYLYGESNIEAQKIRYKSAVNNFVSVFGERDNLHIFSAPGRTEIGGNHTDHNFGIVLAASVNLDVIAVVSPNSSNEITVKSEGYPGDTININDLEIKQDESNKSISLIRGIVSRFKQQGLKIGGFEAYTTSNVLKGSGLSSSAAFEVLIGTILNGLYNNNEVSPVQIAKIAQYSENVYFKKPCGLMDQMASSVGGIISIDFKDEQNPIISKIDFDFTKSGYALCIVDTGGNHADLTDEYASIPNEMKNIASYFGKKVLREIDKKDIYKNISKLREKFGDRAVLRSLHFFDENERVTKQVKMLCNKDFDGFKKLIINSGNSSYKYLQNVYANINFAEQGLSLALYLANEILQDKGAYRVHGGGFGGTTQNFVPLNMVDEFKQKTEMVFGNGKCHILSIRPIGGLMVL